MHQNVNSTWLWVMSLQMILIFFSVLYIFQIFYINVYYPHDCKIKKIHCVFKKEENFYFGNKADKVLYPAHLLQTKNSGLK